MIWSQGSALEIPEAVPEQKIGLAVVLVRARAAVERGHVPVEVEVEIAAYGSQWFMCSRRSSPPKRMLC